MNLILNLSPETEAKLYEQAREIGKAPEEFALTVLQTSLAESAVAPSTLPLDEWLGRYDAWVTGHSSRNPHVNDSRESIYPDRW